MHYNTADEGSISADLHTYMADPDVFKVIDGHIEVLQGMSHVTVVPCDID